MRSQFLRLTCAKAACPLVSIQFLQYLYHLIYRQLVFLILLLKYIEFFLLPVLLRGDKVHVFLAVQKYIVLLVQRLQIGCE